MSIDKLADVMAISNAGDCPELAGKALSLVVTALDTSDVTAVGPRRVLL